MLRDKRVRWKHHGYFETAQTAIEASLTGHFVFSTLHTNDAASTVTRLVDMGVEPFLICSSLVGVLGQRLIRRVCRNCRSAYVPTDEDLVRIGITREMVGDRKFYIGKGCPTCNHTGYKGRKALTELLVVDNEIRELINNGAPSPCSGTRPGRWECVRCVKTEFSPC